MKKILSAVFAAVLSLSLLTACGGSKGITIAVPNDTTNEARALLLLEKNGYIKLKSGAGITATIKDIEENPYNITFKEVEAAQLPNMLKDVDYAVINSNFAIQADLNPVSDSLLMEDSSSEYGNIVAVKEGNEGTDAVKALKAALESKKVKDFITEKYNGAVVSTVDNPGDGYDASVDYAALAGKKITVAASPTPHAEILKIAKDILAEKNVQTMYSQTTWLKAARLTQTTSSISRILTISTKKTEHILYQSAQFMLNLLHFMPANRRRLTLLKPQNKMSCKTNGR